MEAFSDSAFATGDGPLECLRDVVGVHVMKRLEPEIRQRDSSPPGQRAQHVGIAISRWADGRPSGPDDVPGMENRDRHSSAARLGEQELLDRGLANAVRPKRPALRAFPHRYFANEAMHPHGAAMDETDVGARQQRLHQLRCGADSETGQVDDDVRVERRYSLPEGASRFVGVSIDSGDFDAAPSRMREIRLAFAPADAHDRVPRADKPRDEVAADMARPADDNDPQRDQLLTARRFFRPAVRAKVTRARRDLTDVGCRTTITLAGTDRRRIGLGVGSSRSRGEATTRRMIFRESTTTGRARDQRATHVAGGTSAVDLSGEVGRAVSRGAGSRQPVAR